MASLFVIRGIDQGSRFELKHREMKIGRISGNDIQLQDVEVSRFHARVTWTNGEYCLFDAESSNGTYVNGQRIRSRTLASGDEIRLGATIMLFKVSPEPASTATETVSIVQAGRGDDHGRILRSISDEDVQDLLPNEPVLPADVSHASWISRARASLQVIYQTAMAISHTLDIDELLKRVLELVFKCVEADRGCILIVNSETKRLEPKIHRVRENFASKSRFAISRTILDYVMNRAEGVLTSNAVQDNRWDTAASILQEGIIEAICVPMRGRYGVLGAIYLDTVTAPKDIVLNAGVSRLTEDELKLMIAVAHQVGLAVEDTRYYSAMVQTERLAAIGQTIATLSHHIKNILQGIRGGGYLIEMGLKDRNEDAIEKGWKIVEKNQNRIHSLVLDMLTFSKEREPELVESDLNQVMLDVVELGQARAQEVGVFLEWRPGYGIPLAMFDPEGMHRAALNLVSNAIDAAAEVERPGTVVVSTEFASRVSKLRIVVEDNGPGIPPDQLENLFNPFVSTKKNRGTGLGLPVSRKIVQEHGGQILVESTPGSGSRFTIEFPVVKSESRSSSRPSSSGVR